MLTFSGTTEICKRDVAFMNELGKGMQIIFNDLLELRAGLAIKETQQDEVPLGDCYLFLHMPEAAFDQLDLAFCDKLIASHLTLSFKTFTPAPAALACLAEDMLLVWSSNQMYYRRYNTTSNNEEVDNFLGAVIGDLDFRLLENPDFERLPAKKELGMTSMRSDWFQPYMRPLDLTHPFTWPASHQFQYQMWDFLE